MMSTQRTLLPVVLCLFWYKSNRANSGNNRAAISNNIPAIPSPVKKLSIGSILVFLEDSNQYAN
jgi:hypothetical protein